MDTNTDSKKIYSTMILFICISTAFIFFISIFYSSYYLEYLLNYLLEISSSWKKISVSSNPLLSHSLDLCIKFSPILSFVSALLSIKYVGFNKSVSFFKSILSSVAMWVITYYMLSFLIFSDHEFSNGSRYYSLISMSDASIAVYYALVNFFVYSFTYLSIVSAISLFKRTTE